MVKLFESATLQPAPTRTRSKGRKKSTVRKNYTGAIVALAYWAILELRRTSRRLTILDADRTEVVES